jgi:hypothetical protein
MAKIKCVATDHYFERQQSRWLCFFACLLAVMPSCARKEAEFTTDPRLATEEPAPELAQLAYFQDVTKASWVQFTFRNGEEADHHAILESLGGGVALFDYDGDGLLDIFLTGGGYFDGPEKKQIKGYPCKLYKNLGNWRFQDVTAAVGLDQPLFYSQGCAVADYDRDGWPDLLVTGYGRLALYHNEGGRRFVEVTRSAGLLDTGWSTSAAFADLDGDGYPDLFVCHYAGWSFAIHHPCIGDNPSVKQEICPPTFFPGAPQLLYRNNGNGTFTDATKEAGFDPLALEGKALGVVMIDINDDRRPEIYVANDTVNNFLFLNNSLPGKFRFQETALQAGVALGDRGAPDGSMGVDAADYNGCGRPSLWVTTFERQRHALYQNDFGPAGLFFQYATWKSGIGGLGPNYVGFGTAFVDIDLDGWEDLVVTNGHVRRHPTRCPLAQRPVLLRNTGQSRFINITNQGGSYFQEAHIGRGLAVGDLDNDGRPDLVISHQNVPVALLRNAPQGADAPTNHWLGVELVGHNHRDVVGAKLVLEVAGRRLTRFAKGGGSYLSSSDRRILFGLGTSPKIGDLTVYWPSGKEQHWQDLTVDRYWQLIEGQTAAR